MSIALSEEQSLLRDSAQSFLAGRAPVEHLRRLRDAHDPDGFSRELWSEFAQQGYSAALVPEAHGGLGLGVVEAGLISEQIGHTLTPSPFLSTAVLGAWAIAQAGSESQRAQMLPAVAKGAALLALAVDEQTRHCPDAIATRATTDGAGWRIDGEKRFVVDAHIADTFIVATRTSDRAITLFLVDAKSAGVRIERTVMIDAHNAGRVRLSGVVVGTDAVLGGLGTGGALLEQLLDVGRSVVAAQLLGIADEVFARTTAYLRQRRQFDRLIGEFQALQHRAAALYCQIEMTRAIVLKALRSVEADPAGAAALVSQAKAHACRSADRAVREGVQMHGGIGMTDAFDIGLFMKRARVLQELFGDAGFHAQRIAALAGY